MYFSRLKRPNRVIYLLSKPKPNFAVGILEYGLRAELVNELPSPLECSDIGFLESFRGKLLDQLPHAFHFKKRHHLHQHPEQDHVCHLNVLELMSFKCRIDDLPVLGVLPNPIQNFLIIRVCVKPHVVQHRWNPGKV